MGQRQRIFYLVAPKLFFSNELASHSQEGYSDWIVWVSGVVQTVLYLDFFYYYIKWCVIAVPVNRNNQPDSGRCRQQAGWYQTCASSITKPANYIYSRTYNSSSINLAQIGGPVPL
jgi:hypothetical protein